MNIKTNNNSILKMMDNFNINSSNDVKKELTELFGEIEYFEYESESNTYHFIKKDSYLYDIRLSKDEKDFISIEMGVGGISDMIREGSLDEFKSLINGYNYSNNNCVFGALIPTENINPDEKNDHIFVTSYRVISSDINNKQGFKSHIQRAVDGINQYIISTMDIVFESK